MILRPDTAATVDGGSPSGVAGVRPQPTLRHVDSTPATPTLTPTAKGNSMKWAFARPSRDFGSVQAPTADVEPDATAGERASVAPDAVPAVAKVAHAKDELFSIISGPHPYLIIDDRALRPGVSQVRVSFSTHLNGNRTRLAMHEWTMHQLAAVFAEWAAANPKPVAA